MGRLGGGEILLILLIALLIFGPSKLAGMGKGLGEGLKNFKKGLSHDDDEPPPPEPPAPVWPDEPKALAAGTAPAPGTVPAAGTAPAAEPTPATERSEPPASSTAKPGD